MVVVFLPVLMVIELFLIFCFDFRFPYHNKSVFNQLANFLPFELSRFRLRSTWRRWRRFFSLVLFIFIFWLKVAFFIRFGFLSVLFPISFSSGFFSTTISSVPSFFLFSFFLLLTIFFSIFCRKVIRPFNNRYLIFFHYLWFLRFGIFRWGHLIRSWLLGYDLSSS